MTDFELMFGAGVFMLIFGLVSGYAPTIKIRRRY
jgi:hypothetical protein